MRRRGPSTREERSPIGEERSPIGEERSPIADRASTAPLHRASTGPLHRASTAPKSFLNFANAITVARALVAPLLVWIVLTADGGASLLAAVLFMAAAASDALDGHIARTRGVVTRLGTMLDPFVDKLLIGAGLAALATTGRVGAWVVAVVLAREVAVTWLRGTGRRDGIVVGARAAGKAKMALQCLTVTVLLAAPRPDDAWIEGLVWAMVAATLLSGIDYANELRGARARRLRPRPVPGA